MRKNVFAVLIVFCIALLVSCGKTVPSADAEQTELFTLSADWTNVAGAETLDEADVACVPLDRDGKLIGFEMRFSQSAKLDSLFSDAENLYYGIVDSGKKTIAIPMEQIRILTDGKTHEFVLTLLLPSGEKLSGRTCEVTFCTAARSPSEQHMLFYAYKEISLP